MRKYSAVLKINWIQALEYRANALVGVIAIISGLFIEYQIWSLIFISQDLTHVNGFNFYELMVFIFSKIQIENQNQDSIVNIKFRIENQNSKIPKSKTKI